MYSLNLKANKQEFKAKGETMLEAVQSLTHPMFIKTKAIIEAKKGRTKTQRILKPFQLNKLKSNKVYQVIFSKNLELFLK